MTDAEEGLLTAEPTMEEILASIRRIIAEDDALPPSPPQGPEFFLAMITGRQTREAVLGDMAEAYDNAVTRFGVQRARQIYVRDVVFSCLALLRSGLLRLTGAAYLIDKLRHLF